MVQTCIMNTIRDGIPVETLLRQYIDETQEIEIIKEEKIVDKIKQVRNIIKKIVKNALTIANIILKIIEKKPIFSFSPS